MYPKPAATQRAMPEAAGRRAPKIVSEKNQVWQPLMGVSNYNFR
jgi:hypothetical protein